MSEPDKKKQRQAPLHLKVKLVKEDDCQFVDASFSVQVLLQDDSGSLKRGDDVPLKLSLVFEDHPGTEPQPSSGKGLLVVEGKGGAIIKGGRAEVNVKITDVSMNYDNRKFCILATSAQNLAHVAPGKSHGVKVIKHRLELCQDPTLSWEVDWYKDEGGRDKSIPLHIRLLDAKGDLVKNRALPLKVTLHYDKTLNLAPLTNQNNEEILKLSPDSVMTIQDGKASLRVRIEDVSKNHQGQPFVISVGPDPSDPFDHDVHPAFSPAVLVKSKRNKGRQRKPPNQPAPLHNPNPHYRSTAIGASPSHIEMNMSSVGSLGGGGEGLGGGGEIDQPGEVNKSLKTIFSWINKVLTDLPNMRWEQIPATRNPDGTLAAMPKHIMPYPNDHIADIIQVYQLEVMGSLQVVLNQLEAQQQASDGMDTTATETSADGGAGVGGSGPAEDYSASSSGRNGGGGGNGSGGVDGLGPMPGSIGLSRQQSNTYFGPGTSSANDLPIWTGGDPTYVDTAAIESNVWYIVAKVFTLKTAKIGSPAFDRNKNLLGFFNERENDNSHAATDIDFIPLTSLRGVAQMDLRVAEESLKAEINKASQSVFSIDGHNNDLDKTKEAAMMYIWSKKQPDGDGEIDDIIDPTIFDLLTYGDGGDTDAMHSEV